MYYIIKKINVIYNIYNIRVKSGKCAKWNLHQFQNLILMSIWQQHKHYELHKSAYSVLLLGH